MQEHLDQENLPPNSKYIFFIAMEQLQKKNYKLSLRLLEKAVLINPCDREIRKALIYTKNIVVGSFGTTKLSSEK